MQPLPVVLKLKITGADPRPTISQDLPAFVGPEQVLCAHFYSPLPDRFESSSLLVTCVPEGASTGSDQVIPAGQGANRELSAQRTRIMSLLLLPLSYRPRPPGVTRTDRPGYGREFSSPCRLSTRS